jgi:hypothetical protein
LIDDVNDVPDDDDNGNFPIVQIDDLDWELVKYTVEGGLGNCHAGDPSKGIAYFAVRRRCVSKRLDHITEVLFLCLFSLLSSLQQILVLHRNDPLPDDFEIILKSLHPEGLDSNSQSSSRIAVKRASLTPQALIHGVPIIDDICLVNSSAGETPPDEYIYLDKPLDTATLSQLRLSMEKIHLIYRHRPAMGLCDLPFEATTLDRYPMQDCREFSLPATELPVFVFPHSLKLKQKPKSNFPLPNFFTFVFTDVKGRHLYTACLRFYELIPFDVVKTVADEIYGSDVQISLGDSNAFFCPKVICVVSQFPFYRSVISSHRVHISALSHLNSFLPPLLL